MKSIDYSTSIKESPEELRALLTSLTSHKLRDRCEVLLWLKTGNIATIKEAVVLKGLNPSSGYRWWRIYKHKGMKGLLRQSYQGQPSPLKEKKELDDKLAADGFATIKEAAAWIKSTYGISYTENGLGNYFRARKIKLKTGRPQHPKQDAAKRSAYKKNTNKN